MSFLSGSRVSKRLGVLASGLALASLAGCGSTTTPADGGSTTPQVPSTLTIAASSQPQTLTLPPGSGPVTGTVTVPPISVAAGTTGNLTLSVLSGTNVSFERATPPSTPGRRASDASLPGGPYILEITLTAPFTFTLPSIPAFSFNLGSVGVTNASYLLVVQVGSGSPVEFPINAVGDTLSFPGIDEPVTVTAGTVLYLGLELVTGIQDAGPSVDAGPAAVFVVDSTGYLYAFDANGNLRQKVLLPGTVADENGGEVALANGAVYVTLGTPTNAVVSYSQSTLEPLTLGGGAFSGLFVPRGIVYDTDDAQFFIGNGGSTIKAYDMYGGSAATPGGFPNNYGPSGVAYDSLDHTIWVANYVGSPCPSCTHGTAEYTESGGTAQTINLATQFVSPNAHTEPFSIGYCPGACLLGNIFVGFIDDGSGLGSPVIAAYSVDGGSSSALTGFSFLKPYQLSFDSQTFLWVADKGALHKIGLGSGDVLPPGFATALTPPIFGVAAN
jgi:hypothetical protein